MKEIFNNGELDRETTARKSQVVRKEYARLVNREFAEAEYGKLKLNELKI